MRRKVTVIAALVLVALVAAGVGAYAYYFAGLRTAPKQLALSSPVPSASPSAAATASSGLAGKWTIGSGSLAGYRASEVFAGTSSPHQAVARTSSVTGGVSVGDAAGGAYPLTGISFSVGLAGLHSVDQVAGRDVSFRDNIVRQQLEVDRFPQAVFTAAVGTVPDKVTSQAVDVSVPGKLTIHGVTRDVTATGKAQLNGGRIEIAGSLSIDMSDYQVPPPQVGFVTVSSKLTIDFDLFLSKP